MKAIIIDDERKGRIALKQKLHDYCPQVQLLGEASSAAEGLALIEKDHPDIEMTLKLDAPFSIHDYRKTRKLLQLANDEIGVDVE